MDVLNGAEGGAAGDEYCRAIEAYLCRKNDGHLIRIVGPAFERVCAWADRGVPLKVACRGIDRYFERYYAKGARRRPVRVEFCEADVLDVFDEWRRAVGVLVARERPDGGDGGPVAGETEDAEATYAASRSRTSLAAHLDRAVSRLTSLRAAAAPLAGDLDAVLGELESLRAHAKALRGGARQAAVERLRALDTELIERTRDRLDPAALQEIRREAEVELAPFRARMAADAYSGSLAACVDRIIRERARLPSLAYE